MLKEMNVKVNRAGLRDHHAAPRNGCTTIPPPLKLFTFTDGADSRRSSGEIP
jgi:hypothetical protein